MVQLTHYTALTSPAAYVQSCKHLSTLACTYITVLFVLFVLSEVFTTEDYTLCDLLQKFYPTAVAENGNYE